MTGASFVGDAVTVRRIVAVLSSKFLHQRSRKILVIERWSRASRGHRRWGGSRRGRRGDLARPSETLNSRVGVGAPSRRLRGRGPLKRDRDRNDADIVPRTRLC